jgi:hypothetical protein
MLRLTLSARSVAPPSFIAVRWATKKAVGSTKNGRDSNPQFLGGNVLERCFFATSSMHALHVLSALLGSFIAK